MRWIYLTDGNSSTVSVSVSVIGSNVKLSLYRDRLNARGIDGSSTTNSSPI